MIKEVYDDIINLTLSIKSSIKKERNLLINNNVSINIAVDNIQKIITKFKQYLEEYSCLKNNPIIDILNKYNDDLLHIINEDNKDNVLIILDNITDSLLDKVQENIIVKDDILSLTLIVKNEAFYIKEWIEFHRMIGVTHFYIYDNESSDDFVDFSDDLIDEFNSSITEQPVSQTEPVYTKEEQDILSRAPRNTKGELLAPNGNVSNLTEKQYVQVRTKAFKEWFEGYVEI